MSTVGSVENVGVVRILNCVPSPDTENDWRLQNADEAGLLAAAPAAVPSSKDLRDDGWWSVGDQLATGSCVGWASADSVLRWHFVTANWVPSGARLSPRFQWMAAKETDVFLAQPTTFIETAGTSLKAALDIARKYGAVRDSLLPFEGGGLYSGEVGTFYAIAAQLRINAYFNLGQQPDSWRQWLSANGPILTRLNVDETWSRASETGGNLDKYKPDTVRGGHAVALVGYTPDRFIVRNSWGTGWGDGGYAYASLDYAEEAFTEAYGIAI
jgi:Papain family cysteine protease